MVSVFKTLGQLLNSEVRWTASDSHMFFINNFWMKNIGTIFLALSCFPVIERIEICIWWSRKVKVKFWRTVTSSQLIVNYIYTSYHLCSITPLVSSISFSSAMKGASAQIAAFRQTSFHLPQADATHRWYPCFSLGWRLFFAYFRLKLLTRTVLLISFFCKYIQRSAFPAGYASLCWSMVFNFQIKLGIRVRSVRHAVGLSWPTRRTRITRRCTAGRPSVPCVFEFSVRRATWRYIWRMFIPGTFEVPWGSNFSFEVSHSEVIYARKHTRISFVFFNLGFTVRIFLKAPRALPREFLKKRKLSLRTS